MAERVRVLVVDDSSFYRKRIRQSLNESPQIEVVGEAANGEEALRLTKQLSPALVTMDVAMPVMDGISAVRQIMAEHPTRIIMFSALTKEGARATLDALDAGAVDFLPKSSPREPLGSSAVLLRERVLAVATDTPMIKVGQRDQGFRGIQPAASTSLPVRKRKQYPKARLLLIGASTGGPVAVQQVLAGLPADLQLPVLVVIHMPGTFTTAYAERLNSITSLQVSEAQDGAVLQAGGVLVAPGGLQTRVVSKEGRLTVSISKGAPDDLYHPSIDRTLESVAHSVGAGGVGIILTGMGSDGAKGALALHRVGGRIWAQDQASSIVYGMPRAVKEAGVAEHILSLDRIAPTVVEELQCAV